MNVSILSQVGGIIGFVGSSGLLIAMIIFPDGFGMNPNAYIYTISDSISNTDGEEINNNYECKFKDHGKETFYCDVYMWEDDIDQTKNQYKIDNIEKYKKQKFDNNDLKKGKNIFKVVISGSTWERKDLTDHKTKNIEIVKKGDANKKYGDLKQIFSKYKGKITGSTTYFVGKASENVVAASTFKCKLNSSDETKDCTINEFSDRDSQMSNSEYATLEFKKPTNSTSLTITKDKYYLIKLDDSQKQNIENVEKEIICLCTPTTTGLQATEIKFKQAKSAVYDGQSKHILVF